MSESDMRRAIALSLNVHIPLTSEQRIRDLEAKNVALEQENAELRAAYPPMVIPRQLLAGASYHMTIPTELEVKLRDEIARLTTEVANLSEIIVVLSGEQLPTHSAPQQTPQASSSSQPPPYPTGSARPAGSAPRPATSAPRPATSAPRPATSASYTPIVSVLVGSVEVTRECRTSFQVTEVSRSSTRVAGVHRFS